MDHYAGIDVSLEYSSVCVVDANGKIVREGKVASEPNQPISAPGSLASLASRTILPLVSTTHTLEHSKDTSIPA